MPGLRGLRHVVALVAVCSALQTVFAQSLPSHQEACLLRQLRDAPATLTVAELRERCAPQPPPALPLLFKGISPAAVEKLPGPVKWRDLLATPDAERSVVNQRIASEIRTSQEPFGLLPHRPNYILPLAYHQRPSANTPQRLASNPGPFVVPADTRQPQEMQFQTSLKFPLSEPLLGMRLIPIFAYTGKAWWQVYDAQRSRPFREYNHEPEFFVAIAPSTLAWGGWQHRLTTLGFAHHSNGRSAPSSRSWNRVFAEATFDRGRDYWASLKLWHRLSESPKAAPSDQVGDDNPDITRYFGNGEFRFGYRSASGTQITFTARQAIMSGGKGAAQLDWSRPTGNGPHLRYYVQGFAGYGDSLIDYNTRVNRLGVGLMLNDWF